MKGNTLSTPRVIRWLVLAASTTFFLFFSRLISEHAICPIGGFELFFNSFFRSGFSIAGLFSGMVLIFLIMSILSIIFRRAYCGYICPLGALQELFERIGAFILPRKTRKMRIPAKIDRPLRWMKYLVLASFIVGAAVVGGHWMIPGDPFIVFMSLFGRGGITALVERLPFAFAFFLVILAFSFFFGKGFCKYLCPAGAWYALLSKLSPNKMVRNAEKCVGCGLCTKACPMDIDVAHSKKVTSAECIGCRECVNACPKEGALTAPIGSIGVPVSLVPIASAAVFAGSVYIASASMPARGERPRGNGERGQGIKQGEQFPQNTKQVGFGGCSDCIGCGFCESLSKV